MSLPVSVAIGDIVLYVMPESVSATAKGQARPAFVVRIWTEDDVAAWNTMDTPQKQALPAPVADTLDLQVLTDGVHDTLDVPGAVHDRVMTRHDDTDEQTQARRGMLWRRCVAYDADGAEGTWREKPTIPGLP